MVLLFAQARIAVASALQLTLPRGAAPAQRYDHRRRKSEHAAWEFVEPAQLPVLLTALGSALASDPPLLEYELADVVEDACRFTSALTLGYFNAAAQSSASPSSPDARSQ